MNTEFEKKTARSLLELLSKNQNLSQRDMARRIGVSLGKTNACLKRLAEEGFVEVKRGNKSIGKKRLEYVVTPRGVAEKAELTFRFLKKKLTEYEEIRCQIKELNRDMEQEDLRELL